MVKAIIQTNRFGLRDEIIVHALDLLSAVAILVSDQSVNVESRSFWSVRIKLKAPIHYINFILLRKLL
ncbi:hypothetical protein D3C73_1429670 [compost metagenome]